jgi:hypothetical protein
MRAARDRQKFGSVRFLRCHAYLIRSERYLDIEDALMQKLASASRAEVLEMIGKDFFRIELLSGEWRVLFTQHRVTDSYQPVASDQLRMARLMAAPDQLAPLVNTLWMHELHDKWKPITFGLQHLTYGLPLASGLIGAVFLEETPDWQQAEPTHEIMAISAEVFALLSPFIHKLVDRGDFTMLARLAADHCESAIEFTADRWLGLREQSQARAPELVRMIDGCLITPESYDRALAAMKRMLDAHLQPSLDAWLRVHAERGRYALLFRDIRREAAAARPTLSFQVAGLR